MVVKAEAVAGKDIFMAEFALREWEVKMKRKRHSLSTRIVGNCRMLWLCDACNLANLARMSLCFSVSMAGLG